MSAGIQGIMNWQTWRAEVSVADGSPVTEFEPEDLVAARSVSVTPYTAIVFLPLIASDTVASDTVDVKIIGYMASHVENGAGPGQALWFATLKVPAVTPVSMSITGVPLTDGKWSEQAWTFFEDADYASKYNEVSAVEIGGNVSEQLSILFPTLGYTTLMMEVTNFVAGANVVFGCMWRGVSKEGAI